MTNIYIIKNKINDKTYIGQTIKNIDSRFAQHIYFATTKQNKCIKLERAIKKHGLENFWVELLTSNEDQNKVNDLEKFYIKKFNSIKNGYNIKEGGANGALPQSIRDKISAAQLGEKNHMFGKHLSDETKKKISDKVKGENHPLYGTHHSDETKKLIGTSSKGRECFWKGKQLSEEACAKISATRINKKIASGENNYKSKLSNLEASEIRNSSEKYKILAEKYRVSISCIQKIKSGISYKE